MNRLKILREEKGLFQKDIADYLNCSIAIISMYEKEQRVMDVNIAQKLANYFECSLDYLLGKSNKKNYNEIEKELLNIGLSKKDYTPPTKEQQEKIEEFARFVLKDNLKNREGK